MSGKSSRPRIASTTPTTPRLAWARACDPRGASAARGRGRRREPRHVVVSAAAASSSSRVQPREQRRPDRRRRGAASPGEPLDPRFDLPARDRPAAYQAPLGTPEPALVVAGGEVHGRLHLLADRASRALDRAAPIPTSVESANYAKLPRVSLTRSEPGARPPRTRAFHPCRGRRP